MNTDMNINGGILSALHYIDVSQLSRGEWIAVGMALKEEGFSCSTWDDWSRDDIRYHPGECERLWDGFHGCGSPVTGGTIVQMAKERGWKPYENSGVISWDDVIAFDGVEGGVTDIITPLVRKPADELVTYINTLFAPDDYVGYVTNDVWQNEDGKWVPQKGVFYRKASEIVESLKKHPDDIGAAIGDWKPDAGAWIRVNPLDGQGVKNENVTSFRYVLVESDTIPVDEQEKLFRKLELPIATLVHSGGKSIHAVVHIDAETYDEYKKRVDFLYDYLEKNGVTIDKQNCNPSRLSRMPGVTRNGKTQYLIATNIGRKSWNDWVNYINGVSSEELPPIVSLAEYQKSPPPLPEELIKGILRVGHKMLVSGSSKASKSFLLMELCVSIAEGIPWLGFEVKRGKVLYVNLEIDEASTINRIFEIYHALGISNDDNNVKNILLWNLRGHAKPFDQLVPDLISRARDLKLDAIIIDPIYKVIMGDENNASDMGAFCNQFDKICTSTGCATIYCHHHSKGYQGGKNSMDRASGSGVFARDPDAVLDIIELETSNNAENGRALRMESSLREFESTQPVNFWFKYPIHIVDTEGKLTYARIKKSNEKITRNAYHVISAEDFRKAYDVLSQKGTVAVKDFMDYFKCSDKTIYAARKKLEKEFSVKKKIISRIEKSESNS